MKPFVPDMRYLLNAPLVEFLRAALYTDPGLREKAPEIAEKLAEWLEANDYNGADLVVGMVILLGAGTVEGQIFAEGKIPTAATPL